MIHRIDLAQLQQIKNNASEIEAPFIDFYISIFHGIVAKDVFDKQDYFDFDIENFPFLKGHL